MNCLKLALLILIGCGNLGLPTPTYGESQNFCEGAEFVLSNPFPDVPVYLTKNVVQSSYVTTGALEIQNSGMKYIDEISLQIRYGMDNHGAQIRLTYAATVFRPKRSHFLPLKEKISPNETIRLITEDLQVIKTCPKNAAMVSVRIQFSDGTEIHRENSAWIREPTPRNFPKLSIAVDDVPSHEMAYLVRINIDATGRVTGIRDLLSTNSRLPKALSTEIERWAFYPSSSDDVPRPSELNAVIRIILTGCKVQECEIPIPRQDLPTSFALIDLVPGPSGLPSTETIQVYFGGVPVTEGEDMAW
jgi:hypothetical protein